MNDHVKNPDTDAMIMNDCMACEPACSLDVVLADGTGLLSLALNHIPVGKDRLHDESIALFFYGCFCPFRHSEK
jgi:hypothetical protein